MAKRVNPSAELAASLPPCASTIDLAMASPRPAPSLFSMLTMLNLPACCRLHGAAAPAVRRIAAPMVGGMISATILTLIVIPAIYALVKEFTLRREGREGE